MDFFNTEVDNASNQGSSVGFDGSEFLFVQCHGGSSVVLHALCSLLRSVAALIQPCCQGSVEATYCTTSPMAHILS